MNYISVCSGIEAATVAWHPLGWKAAAYSEIEPFPSAVLAHHYPDVPNVGDMTKYKEWNIEPGSVDLLVGGTPCQSFSVAGLRKGLADPRGNLALVYCGILDHFKPRWFVWENVPGVLSSGGGRDFGSFLGAVAELGYGFAYRVLDAQYFGVAQRRRRVFVVGHLGDWKPAAKVLFERDCLRRDSAPSREAGEISAARTGFSVTGSVTGAYGPRLGTDESCQGSVISQPYPVANTLTARMHKGINSTLDEKQTPIVQSVGFDSYNHAVTGDVSKTLDVGQDYHHVPNVFQPVAFHPTQDPISSTDGSTHALGCGSSGGSATVAVAQAIGWDEELNASTEQSGTLLRGGQGGRHDGVMDTTMQVRRLTPVECERLQGFPDNYTAIPWRKKPANECPDGPRYKALGNSMAVPVMAWIGRRINELDA
jgi:DNA (cytosine-5)-methyltransferase 1